ncbi:hypothetical protein KXD40_007588 [Peronospora effusa]|uniref:Uncharacterized protein n=1 Tax=Peronospora effusa TaxID=542832 RepID=A0A3M6VMN2_9STRA|nr:hypothetical protein DD238_002140 [Peronospora effusa]RQM16921.1 hypothetical protein DD237_002761 [Peronospora effusa]UIZ29183.1 hypothetical protein KXD40_007588 [Peronospora effusa]CAI5704146.1 unnamed protein product [Peronospora effusa]
MDHKVGSANNIPDILLGAGASQTSTAMQQYDSALATLEKAIDTSYRFPTNPSEDTPALMIDHHHLHINKKTRSMVQEIAIFR